MVFQTKSHARNAPISSEVRDRDRQIVPVTLSIQKERHTLRCLQRHEVGGEQPQNAPVIAHTFFRRYMATGRPWLLSGAYEGFGNLPDLRVCIYILFK